jgi:hypothetical protein
MLSRQTVYFIGKLGVLSKFPAADLSAETNGLAAAVKPSDVTFDDSP